MNSIVVTSTKQNIKFGYEGEDNVTKIIFPYDESWLEYGEGNFEVRILRCGDEVAYTATDVVDDRQAMTLTMTVTDIELSVRGRGEMQLCYVCPDSIKKSPIYQYTVNRSVDYKYAVDPPEGSIIASVEKSLSEIKNTTNRLSNSVISIESSIDDVNSQIDNINDKISEFDEEIDSIGEVETRVDNLETSTQSINGRINTAEGNINENTESISDLNESVTELENRKVTDLETSGGKSDSGKYLTVGTDGKIKATSLTIPPTITVDASLSTTSTNPVQNKVIKTELNNINSNIETCNTEISKLNGSLDTVQADLDILFNRPTLIFDGVLTGDIATTSTIYSKNLTDLIPVTGGSKVTYQINSLIPSDASKISNIKLVVLKYDTNGDLIGQNSYSTTISPKLASEVCYIQLGISASLSNANGESITCDVDVFYTDESQDTYLGDVVIVKKNNVVGLPKLTETVEEIDSRVDVLESKEVNYTESGNAKTGIWEHLTWSSVNGFVAEPESVQQHSTMKIQGEVSGGQYYTLAWNNEVRARIYIFEFSDNTYLPSAQTTVKAENWLPYNASTHEYAYNKQILLNENTKYIAVMVYLSAGADNWQDLILDNLYFQPGMDATGYVQSDIFNTSRISAVNLFDQLSEGNIIDGVPQPPEYYNEHGYLYNKCERINSVLKRIAVNGDAFIFVTDQHWYLNAKQSPKLIRYIARHCHVPRLISGGDTDNGGSAELCKLYRYAFDGNIHHVVGNHDLMTSKYKKSDGAILYYMMDAMNDNQIGNNYGHYYYVDCHQQKIRYVALSAFRGGGDSGTAVYDYSAEQLQWFTTEALNAPDGYGIIIFTHFLMHVNIPPAATPFVNAIDEYTGNGKIIAVIQGHTHYDGLFSTSTGIPVVTVTCDKNEPWISGGTDMEPWLTSDRETGTVYEQAFDVIGVDSVNGIIHAVRIGGLAMDNYTNMTGDGFSSEGVAEERIVHCNPVDISSGGILTSSIVGTITWKSSNTDVATVSNGTITKVSTGKAFISASNENGIYEYWSVIAN